MFKKMQKNYFLIKQLVQREIRMGYKGTVIGWIWPILETLLMVCIYTLFLSFFLKVRWGTDPGEQSAYLLPLNLLLGLILYNFFSECLSSSPELIRSQANFVKKIIFPLEILPWILISVRGFYALIALLIWTIFFFLVMGPLPLTSLYCFLLIPPFILLTLGISYFVSALSVYLRDISKLVRFLVTMLMFLSPVFYSTSLIPNKIKTLLLLNPLTYIIEQARACCFQGHSPNWFYFFLYTSLSLIIFYAGYLWFDKLKEGFCDVL